MVSHFLKFAVLKKLKHKSLRDFQMRNSLLLITCLSILFLFFACKSEEKNGQESTESKQEMPKETQMTQEQPTGAKPLSNIPARERANYYNDEPEMIIDQDKQYTAVITTEKGKIVAELNPMYAPLHTNNFVFLARQGFYNGLTFHRVEPNFVIQGGDPLGTGTGGPGYTIPAEFGLPHGQGALAMARRGGPANPEKRSSGSQFYITLQPTPFLDNDYSVFGKVVEGFDVVQSIAVGDLILSVDIIEE